MNVPRPGLWVIVVLGTLCRLPVDADPSTDRLERLDQRAQTIGDLTADFVEKKFTALLKAPLVSRGKVLVKGERTCWKTTSPRQSILYTDSSRVAIYFPSRKTMEVYPVDRRLRALIVSPIPRVSNLRRHFEIALLNDEEAGGDASMLHLRLTPKDEALLEFIESVTVAIDLRIALATRVEMVDPEGDRTVTRFTNIRTNVGLADGDLAWNVPSDTKILYPMTPNSDEQRAERRSERP